MLAEPLNRQQERVIGLAGVLQAAALVQQLARTGVVDEEMETATTGSILVMDAATTPDVFGGIAGVRLGLELLRDKLIGSRSELDVEILKYAVALSYLQRALYRKKQKFQLLAEGMEQLTGLSGESLHDACAELYMTAVSPLSPKIYVQGEHGYLQQEGVPERVRTLLLAGIRAAVLWQQKGGGRVEIMLHRKRYRDIAAEILGYPGP
jgi:high frequency lysogenization protein